MRARGHENGIRNHERDVRELENVKRGRKLDARDYKIRIHDREPSARELETQKRDHDSDFQCTQSKFLPPNVISTPPTLSPKH